MADVRAAWNETGDKLTELGRKLKVHYDEQHTGTDEQAREELAAAARKLGTAVQDAFEAIGSAARDKSVQDDVKQVGQSLAEALGATLGTAAEELRRAFSERKGQAATTESTTESTPGAAAEAAAAEGAAGTEGAVTAEEPGTVTGITEAQAGPTTTGEPTDGEQPPKVEPWGTP